MKIRNQLIELLAIKLYEHDQQDGLWPSIGGNRATSWMKLHEDDRELYRRIACGEIDL